MDAGGEEGEEDDMGDEIEAEPLWRQALALNRAAAAVRPAMAGLPPLLFFTDPVRTPEPWRIAARLPAGAAVVYRAFGRADAVDVGERLRTETARRGVRLLVGRDLSLARRLGADGLHLPERALEQAQALRASWPDALLTGALHEPKAAPAALDAVVISPVFAEGPGSAARQVLGVTGFRRLAAASGRPAYALGGVDGATAADLIGSGACGVAAVGAIVRAYG